MAFRSRFFSARQQKSRRSTLKGTTSTLENDIWKKSYQSFDKSFPSSAEVYALQMIKPSIKPSMQLECVDQYDASSGTVTSNQLRESHSAPATISSTKRVLSVIMEEDLEDLESLYADTEISSTYDVYQC